jgi:DNA gyrase subunit A
MGKKGMSTREEDFVTSIFVANTHAILLVFTTGGKVFPLNVYEVPETSRTAKGRPIVNLVPVPSDERIAAVVTVREIHDDDNRDLLFASRNGLVKRTPLSAYKNIRAGGLIACGVADDDCLRVVKLLNPEDHVDIMLLSKDGQCIRFPKEGPKGAPVFGRSARGNKGINLGEGDVVVDMLLVPHESDELTDEVDLSEDEQEVDEADDDAAPEEDEEEWTTTLLTVTELGYGKRTPFERYPVQGRNGKGVISHKTGEDIGGVVGAREVTRDHQLMLVTDTGRVIRIEAGSVRLVKSRGSKGVRLMRLESEERIVDMARLDVSDEAEEE